MKNFLNNPAMNNAMNNVKGATSVASAYSKNLALLCAEKTLISIAKGATYVVSVSTEKATTVRAARLGVTTEEANAYIIDILDKQVDHRNQMLEKKAKIAALKKLRDEEIKAVKDSYKESLDVVNGVESASN